MTKSSGYKLVLKQTQVNGNEIHLLKNLAKRKTLMWYKHMHLYSMKEKAQGLDHLNVDHNILTMTLVRTIRY